MKYIRQSLIMTIAVFGFLVLSPPQAFSGPPTKEEMMEQLGEIMSTSKPGGFERFITGVTLDEDEQAAVDAAGQAAVTAAQPTGIRACVQACFGCCCTATQMDQFADGLGKAVSFVKKGFDVLGQVLGFAIDNIDDAVDLFKGGLSLTEMVAHMNGNEELVANIRRLSQGTDDVAKKARAILQMSDNALQLSNMVIDLVETVEDPKFKGALWKYLSGLLQSSMSGDTDSSFVVNKTNGTFEFYVNHDHATTGPALVIGAKDGFAGSHAGAFTDEDAVQFSDNEYNSFVRWVSAMKANEAIKRDHSVSTFDQTLLSSTVSFFRPYTGAVIFGEGDHDGTIMLFRKGDREHEVRPPLFTVHLPYFTLYAPEPRLLDGTHNGADGRPVDTVVEEE